MWIVEAFLTANLTVNADFIMRSAAFFGFAALVILDLGKVAYAIGS
jgi:hypothetical protein